MCVAAIAPWEFGLKALFLEQLVLVCIGVDLIQVTSMWFGYFAGWHLYCCELFFLSEL